MADNILSYDEVMAYKAADAEGASDPVNVIKFVSHMVKVLQEEFEKADEMYAYLRQLYMLAVFHGKSFKNKIPTDELEGLESSESSGGRYTITGIDRYYTVEMKKKTLCVIVRGTKDKQVRSSLESVIMTADGTTLKLAVVTYKLFQACITIILSDDPKKVDLPFAPLAANIFRDCRLQVCKDNCWGIHGHAGLNFVAKSSYQIKNKKLKKGEKREVNLKLPSVEACMIVAYRLDNQQKMAAKKDSERLSTMRSIIQTTQMSSKDLAALNKAVTEGVKHWGPGLAGAAMQAARALALAIKAVDKESARSTPNSTPASKSSQATEFPNYKGDSEEEEDEE